MTRHFPGHLREVSDQVKGGSLRLAREGFRFARSHGENLGGCGDVPHHIIQTKSSLSSSLADLKDTCRFPLWANGEVRVLV